MMRAATQARGMIRSRRLRLSAAAAALAALALALAVAPLVGADTVFQVPEVLVRHAAVPRPVGTGRPNVSRPLAAPEEAWPDSEQVQQRYEYFIEHSVSTSDAKKMAMMLKNSDIPEAGPGCGVCTKREMEYCEAKVLADHCCCERHFLPEPFPWLPHTCYIGPERCEPLAANCAHYARLRDCCCLPKLAEQWKNILSKSEPMSTSSIALLMLAAVMFTFYV